jgi:hypothetical protein
MNITAKEILINYLNKYGYLFENDTLLLLDDIKIDKQIEDIKKKNRLKKLQLKRDKDKELETLKDYSKDVLKDYSKDVSDDIIRVLDKKLKSKRNKIMIKYLARLSMLNKGELSSIKNLSKKTMVLISGLSLATLLIHTAYQIYKVEKTVVIKKCITKKGKIEKEICIKKHKIDLLKKRLNFLNKNVIKCNYSKDPVNCRNKLDKEILKVRELLRNEILNLGRSLRLEF